MSDVSSIGSDRVAAHDPGRTGQASNETARRNGSSSALQQEDRLELSDGGRALSERERAEVKELRVKDREVRAHEQAHVAAAGNLAKGGIKYDYETGPDGKRYAVGGEVQLDTSPVPDDPEATIAKAERIKRAATAPVDPSAQDRAAAAEADRMAADARQELAQERGGKGGAAQTNGLRVDVMA